MHAAAAWEHQQGPRHTCKACLEPCRLRAPISETLAAGQNGGLWTAQTAPLLLLFASLYSDFSGMNQLLLAKKIRLLDWVVYP